MPHKGHPQPVPRLVAWIKCPSGCLERVQLARCHEDDSIVGYEGTCQKCGHSMTLAFCKDRD